MHAGILTRVARESKTYSAHAAASIREIHDCRLRDMIVRMKVFIQNEAGSFVKHSHEKKLLTLKGEARVSRAYPFPYGFILNTTAEDGDNVDCFVLTREALRTGQVVE